MEIEQRPSEKELVSIIALLILEQDSLRERVGGFPVRFNRRMFTSDDIRRGMDLCPKVSVNNTRSVSIQLES